MSDVPAKFESVPPWPRLLVPVLKSLLTGEIVQRRRLIADAIAISGVEDEAKTERLESGGTRIGNRMNWAVTHLARANLIENTSRGHYRITPEGQNWLEKHPEGMSYSEANVFFGPYWPKKSAGNTQLEDGSVTSVSVVTDPDELMDSSQKANRESVGARLLETLRKSEPAFFEEVVVDLLLAMGYGGAERRGIAIGKTNDGGVDGVIDEDALGLDQLYIQAKRYGESNSIGAPVIQAFVGALHGKSVQKGVFITTSTFTKAALNYANAIHTHLVLIDGERLVNLMMKYRVGVQVKKTYVTLELDADYFE